MGRPLRKRCPVCGFRVTDVKKHIKKHEDKKAEDKRWEEWRKEETVRTVMKS